MKKLKEFFKNVDDAYFILIVYDAVVRAKFMYGLDSIQLNKDYADPLYGKLDTFHLKGIRQNLKFPTTFGKMQNNQPRTLSSPAGYSIANDKINSWAARDKGGGFVRPLKNNSSKYFLPKIPKKNCNRTD